MAEFALLGVIAWSGSSAPTDGIAVRADQAAIRIADQTAVTSTVTVDWVVAPGPSWVVVQTDYDGGAQGAVIGKTHVDSGESVNVEVALEATTLPHAAVVTLIADRGEVGTFEYSGQMSTGGMGGAASTSASADKPYIADGMLVSMPFKIAPISFNVPLGAAAIGSAVRGSDGSTVTASQIVAPSKSWLTVSLVTTSGVPGEVLGIAPIEPGMTPTATVRLQAAVGKNAPLFATLHADLGQPNQFEYSITDVGNSPDQPYVAGGHTVRVQVPPAQ